MVRNHGRFSRDDSGTWWCRLASSSSLERSDSSCAKVYHQNWKWTACGPSLSLSLIVGLTNWGGWGAEPRFRSQRLKGLVWAWLWSTHPSVAKNLKRDLGSCSFVRSGRPPAIVQDPCLLSPSPCHVPQDWGLHKLYIRKYLLASSSPLRTCNRTKGHACIILHQGISCEARSKKLQHPVKTWSPGQGRYQFLAAPSQHLRQICQTHIPTTPATKWPAGSFRAFPQSCFKAQLKLGHNKWVRKYHHQPHLFTSMQFSSSDPVYRSSASSLALAEASVVAAVIAVVEELVTAGWNKLPDQKIEWFIIKLNGGFNMIKLNYLKLRYLRWSYSSCGRDISNTQKGPHWETLSVFGWKLLCQSLSLLARLFEGLQSDPPRMVSPKHGSSPTTAAHRHTHTHRQTHTHTPQCRTCWTSVFVSR